ncbi:MAG: hypothetical protein WD066_04405 [Planctomycetaceae bacterium]
MKKMTLFTLLLVLVLCAVGVGFYRGWFVLSSHSDAAGVDTHDVNLRTDTGKMQEDAQTVKDKAAELTGNATESPAEPADEPTTDEVRPGLRPANDGQPPGAEPNAAPPNAN